MGQKVNPISNRLGIIRGWDSNWYGGKNYGDTLLEDSKIRKYIYANPRLQKAEISRIIIERTLKLVTITICSARPGIIIGRGGQDVDMLKEELKKVTDKEIQININEIKRPELDAVIVAYKIARQLEGKINYRRAVKVAIQNTMRANAEGIKVLVSGRLNGAEMARREMYKEGRTPLHTFRADIDYALSEALTKVGLLGIKVWICRGEVYGKRDLAPSFAQNKDYSPKSDRGDRYDRNDDRGGFKRRRFDDDDREGGRGERGEGRGDRRSTGNAHGSGSNRGGYNRGGGSGYNRGSQGGGGNRGGSGGGFRSGGSGSQGGNRGGGYSGGNRSGGSQGSSGGGNRGGGNAGGGSGAGRTSGAAGGGGSSSNQGGSNANRGEKK